VTLLLVITTQYLNL